MVLALAACSVTPGFLGPDDTPQSVYGSFLAARYANSTRDVAQSAALYAEALQFEPQSGYLSERAFLAALLAGDYARADAAAAAAVGDPGTAQLADLYLKAARLSGARIEAVSTPDERTDAFSELIGAVLDQWALVDDRRFDEADAQASAIASPFAATGQLLVHRALLLERAGRHGEAEDAYRAADTTLRLGDFTTVLLGEFLERRGRADEARLLYRGRLFDTASSPDPQVREALARVEAGGRAPRFPRPEQGAARALYPPAALLIAQAPADYSALFLRLIGRLDPDFQRNTMALAEMLEDIDLDVLARDAYQGIDQGPFRIPAQVRGAWLSYQNGDTAAALETARALANDDGPESTRLVLADILRASERCAEAVVIYEQVTAARLDAGRRADWRQLYYAGVCRQQLDGWAAAEDLFVRALELAPNEPRVLNHLGYNWIVLETRVDEGFALVTRAAELAPQNGAVLDSLGWGHFKQGRINEAVRWLEDATERSPGDPTINWHLGDAYAALGRDLEAEFQWRRALELDPNDAERAVLERRLSQGLSAGPTDLE
jgi:tetratricopeptide (TPR) repeat protein